MNRYWKKSAVLVLAVFGVGKVAGQVTRHYEVVALQGAPAPTAGPSASYGIFGVDPRIGPNGHLVFGGFVNNNGTANYAIWTGRPGNIEALAVQGDPAPGRPAETLDVFFRSTEPPYWVGADGSVGFQARVKPSNDEGAWHGMPGGLNEVAIVNNSVPEVVGATFKSFPGLGFLANGNGEVIVKGSMQGGGVTANDDTAVWTGTPGSLEILIREGARAPGLPAGVKFGDVNFTSLSLQMSMNARSEFCLSAPLVTGVPSNNAALFVGTRQSLTKVLQKGEGIPGEGGFWSTFDKPRLNNKGTVLFENGTPGSPRAFYTRDSGGRVHLAAREQQTPPDLTENTWDQFFFSKPALGGRDHVAFNAGLAPGANFDKDGTWISRDGVTDLVARKGGAAHGFPGQTFAEFQWINFHRAPAVNADGTVIFRAKTDGGADGLWRWRDGEVTLLLAVGDFLNLGGAEVRRVADFSVTLGSGGQSGYPSAFNDCGQLVFRAAFDTGALGTAILLIEDVGDCDGDGVVSLLEEGFGGNPHDPADGATLLPRVHREGAELKLVFLRRIDGSFAYEVESSNDLDQWQEVGREPLRSADQGGIPAGTERVELAIPFAEDRDHVRVRVTRVGRP